MAVGGAHCSILTKFGEEHLQCSICQDLLKSPKTLACLHSFCVECLSQYQKSPEISILCPLCRKETVSPKGGVRQLVTDFKLASMIEEVVQARDTQEIPTCSIHAGRKCLVFCETCSKLICLTCLTESDLHMKHDVGDVSQETEVAGKRQLTKERQQKYEDNLAENDTALETAGVLRNDLARVVQQIRKEVQNKAKEETAKVAAAKECILAKIDQFEIERKRLLCGYTDKLNSRNKTLQQMIHHSKNALNTCNDYDFLQEFSKESSGLRFLTAHPHPTIDMNVSTLEFRPSTPSGGTYLGSLRISEWNLTAASSHSGSCGGRGVTTLRDGRVLVADLWNRQIVEVASSMVISTFKSLKTRPRDIAMTDHHLVVVDDTAFVKMFSHISSGKYFKFSTVPCRGSKVHVDLRSVAIDRSGHIVVGDVRRNVLTEHKPGDGAIVRTLKLGTSPEFLAINCASHDLVSGEYGGIAHSVNFDGDTLFSITPTIKDSKVRCCTGVSCGKDGVVYIAMHNKTTGTGHVHMYDKTGRFVNCIIQGLYLPQGIGLTDDAKQIVVADYDTIKVYTKEKM